MRTISHYPDSFSTFAGTRDDFILRHEIARWYSRIK